MSACHLCQHPKIEHSHYTPSSHCSRKLDDGTWCKCGAYEGHTTGILWAGVTWLAEHWPRRWR